MLIEKLLKRENAHIFEMISKNSQTNQKFKTIENTWKQIETLLQRDLKINLKGGK
jgi:hypothetical protein|tara:strand:+ start:762 stop:926 length:165 start_codon:yes stop_codon:yes gene_type:complete